MKKQVQILLAMIGLLTLILAACQPTAGSNTDTSTAPVIPQTGETATAVSPTELPDATTVSPAATQAVTTTEAPAITEAPAATQAMTSAPGASSTFCNLSAEQEQQLVSAGETLYNTTCAACHGVQGEGQGNFPALSNNADVTAEDPAAMLAILLNPQVHPFVNQLDNQQIASVISYIRSAFGNQASTICPEQITTATP